MAHAVARKNRWRGNGNACRRQVEVVKATTEKVKPNDQRDTTLVRGPCSRHSPRRSHFLGRVGFESRRAAIFVHRGGPAGRSGLRRPRACQEPIVFGTELAKDRPVAT